MNCDTTTEIDQLAAMFYTAMRFLASGIAYEVYDDRGKMKLVPIIQCNEIEDTPENRKLAEEFADEIDNCEPLEVLHILSFRVRDLLVKVQVKQPMKIVAALRSYLHLRVVVLFSDKSNPIPISDPVSPVHDLFHDLVWALASVEPLAVEWIEYDMSGMYDYEPYSQHTIQDLHGVEIDILNETGGYNRTIQ